MTNDAPICGFQGLGGLCREQRAERPEAIRCSFHDDPRWRVCAGCAGVAHRTCGHGSTCITALCETCVHYDGGGHGPRLEQPDEPTTPDAGTITADVRKELIAVVATALEGCESRGMLTLPDAEHATRVAAVAMDALTAHVMLRMLSGLAGAQE